MLTEEFGPGLYNIRFSEYSNSGIFGRVLTDDYDKALDWLVTEFIVPEYQDKVEKLEIGIMWYNSTPEECIEIMKEEQKEHDIPDDYIDNPEQMCQDCEGFCTMSITLEPIYEYTQDDFSFKLITGEDMFYDIRE